jgi:hypothetical protein
MPRSRTKIFRSRVRGKTAVHFFMFGNGLTFNKTRGGVSEMTSASPPEGLPNL